MVALILILMSTTKGVMLMSMGARGT